MPEPVKDDNTTTWDVLGCILIALLFIAVVLL